MNKNDLVKLFAARTNTNLVVSRANVNTLLDIMAEELENGKTILLTRFGRLFLKQRVSRMRHDPRTLTPVPKKESITIRFQPCRSLLERINKKFTDTQ